MWTVQDLSPIYSNSSYLINFNHGTTIMLVTIELKKMGASLRMIKDTPVTTTTTTTVPVYSFFLGYNGQISSAADACNLGTYSNYYGNMADISDISFRLYTDVALTAFAENGYYCLGTCSGGLDYAWVYIGPFNDGQPSSIHNCL